MNTIFLLIRKELLTEWRQRYALNGVLLYVLSSVFIVFLGIKMMNAPTWNALYWLIMLFISINAITKSFVAEPKGRNLYYHGIATPQQIIVAKTLYNIFLGLIMAALAFAAFSIFMENPVQDMLMYVLILLLGSAGFSATFTMLSGIASKSGSGSLLMPVLSFPVIVPLLLVLIKASKKAMDGLDPSLLYADLVVLFIINVMVLLMSYVLFPFLWKE